MKKTILIAALVGMAALCHAQTIQTNTTPTVSGGLSEVWNALTKNTGTNGLAGDTNWVVIPYAVYDVTYENVGFGAAALHKVSDNFWAGVRYESLGNYDSTAGVQAQLQVTKELWGITYTPFIETSVGIGKSALYGNVGPGILVNIHQWQWKTSHGNWALGIAAVADYEHYVVGSTKNGNKIDAGPAINLSFP